MLDDVARFYKGDCDVFRMPDTTTASSALMKMTEDFVINGNADTNSVVGVKPPLATSNATVTTTTGNLGATWTNYAHAQQALLTTNASRARMTGWRVVVSYTGQEQLAAGVMFVATSQAFTANMYTNPYTTYTPNMQMFPLRAGGEWTFYVPMLGNPDFEDPNSATWQLNYWSGMVFIFAGIPTTGSPIRIRSTRSVEYYPEPSSSALVSSMPEPYDPVGMAEAGILSGTAQDNGTDSGGAWTQRVSGAVYNLVRGSARGVVNAARDEVRALMGQNRMPIMQF